MYLHVCRVSVVHVQRAQTSCNAIEFFVNWCGLCPSENEIQVQGENN